LALFGRRPPQRVAGVVGAGVRKPAQVETMLAAQMAATHMASLNFAPRLRQAETIDQLDSVTRVFNQLQRTFTAQVEALKRYRTGGEQKVTVQHVSVSEGGQAIVGNVTQTARELGPERAADAPPALSHSKDPPMPLVGASERGAVSGGARSKSSAPARSKK
jgi:hypothetical protein